MLRKFFAFLFLVIFIALVPPMIILESVAENFFDTSVLTSKILPQTYLPVTALVAEQSAHSPADAELFTQRVRTVFSPEMYDALVKPFFDGVDAEGIDFKSLKVKLGQVDLQMAEKLPVCDKNEPTDQGFRFCIPPVSASVPRIAQIQKIKEMIDTLAQKQIPDRVSFADIQDQQIKTVISTFPRVRDALPVAIMLTGLVLLGIIALIIFSPRSAILKWLGSAMLILALMLGLFILGTQRIITDAQLTRGMTPGISAAQASFVTTVSSFPLHTVELWAFFSAAVGALLFGSGIFLNRHHTKAKKR